ncbi:DUF192 domain-containing protein [Candidatus Woesearchaeota archaeon]|nr:DUF192 domain-containing protein [Candidatus Woesearchaeota archaeon]
MQSLLRLGIRNISRRTVLASRHRLVSSVLGKAWGLMFSSRVKTALVFVMGGEKEIALHMLFVFCPIDVLLLDRKKTVVESRENLKPFAFYTGRRKAAYVIELPAGSISRSRTGVGDRIMFI